MVNCSSYALLPHSKKAQGNTFWIIIAAVIAIVVMVVILVLFTGKTNTVDKGLLDCESKGANAKCVDKGQCATLGGTLAPTFQCSEDTKECCFTQTG